MQKASSQHWHAHCWNASIVEDRRREDETNGNKLHKWRKWSWKWKCYNNRNHVMIFISLHTSFQVVKHKTCTQLNHPHYSRTKIGRIISKSVENCAHTWLPYKQVCKFIISAPTTIYLPISLSFTFSPFEKSKKGNRFTIFANKCSTCTSTSRCSSGILFLLYSCVTILVFP